MGIPFLYILSNLCVFSNKHSSDWSIVPTNANHITASLHHCVTAPLCHHVTVPLHHRITASLHHRVSQSFALPPATKPVSHLPCPLPPNQSVICLAPYHHVTASPHHCITMPPCHHITMPPHHHITASLCHRITASPCHRATTSPCHYITTSPHHRITVLVSHLPCPLPPSQSVICLAPCHPTSQSFALPPTTASLHHHVTTSLCHCITASPYHCITVLVSHLPCPLPPSQSVICLAPCHQTSQSFALPPPPRHRISQSFALPPATKPVSHLPCPLPLHHHVTMPLHHRITALVSHLPCPLPPNQSVICLAPFHQTSQSFALPLTTASLCHHITASLHHRATTSPHHCTTVSPRHHVSQSFVLPPATKPVSQLPCPLQPNQSVICLAPYHRVTASLCHRITMSPRHPQSVICLAPCHQASQSFALPPATKPVSHLPCPLLLCHHVTALVSHLPCPLPPSQSVICLAPCHQTSQSFALPPTTASPCHHITMPQCHRITASPHHRITASPHHCLRFSPPHGYESDWLMLTSTVLIG